MTKQNQRTGVLVAVLIVCAISARVLGKFDVFPVPLGLVRTILYISLYIGWGSLCQPSHFTNTGAPLYGRRFMSDRLLVCYTVNKIFFCGRS